MQNTLTLSNMAALFLLYLNYKVMQAGYNRMSLAFALHTKGVRTNIRLIELQKVPQTVANYRI